MDMQPCARRVRGPRGEDSRANVTPRFFTSRGLRLQPTFTAERPWPIRATGCHAFGPPSFLSQTLPPPADHSYVSEGFRQVHPAHVAPRAERVWSTFDATPRFSYWGHSERMST